MKKVFFSSGSHLPIPDVSGGAVEALLTMLVEQNEIEGKARFVLLSEKNQEAQSIARSYRYTKIHYVDFQKTKRLFSLFWRVCKRFWPEYSANYVEFLNVYYYLLSGCRHFVAESYSLYPYQLVRRLVPKDRRHLHIHAELVPDKPMLDTFYHAIAISDFTRKRWLSACQEGVHSCSVVRNCVDEGRFQKPATDKREKLRQELGLAQDDFVVLYVGRIVSVKGVAELMETVLSIPDERIKLVVAGDNRNEANPYVAQVNTLARQCPKRIKTVGYIPNDRLWAYYQMADVQAIPSLWEEAAGLVAIEGMYAGLPLIITDSGGLVEYPDGECAITVRRSNLQPELAQAITGLKDNPALRAQMGRHGKARAEQYNKKAYYDAFLEVLNG